MSPTRSALACLAATLAAAAPAHAHGHVLSAHRDYAGGTVAGVPACGGSCNLLFEVRAGERYLHVATSAPAGVTAFDVTTATGAVRVCASTAGAGPLSIDGETLVKLRVVLDDPACHGAALPAATGTVTAYFSADPVSFADAVAQAQPDPGRRVGGGL